MRLVGISPDGEGDSDWLPPPSLVLIHGGARGADDLANQWAVLNCVPVLVFRADWKRHGRAAGPIRNRMMVLNGKPDLVVAFPGRDGTADCVRQAREMGIEVREIQARKVAEYTAVKR